MTKNEKEIAEYILKNKEKILNDTSTNLATNIGVGQSSIIKFIRKIGFSKYNEFKIQLGKDIENEKHYLNNELVHNQIYSNDPLEVVLNKLLKDSIYAVDEISHYG